MTFGELLDRYIDSLAGRPAQRDYQQLQTQFFDVPDWRDRGVEAITRYDVLLLMQSLEATKSHANKALGLIRQAYYWGSNTIDHEARAPLYGGANPAEKVKRYACKSREVLMDFSQLRRLVSSLDFLNLKYRAFFTMRILAPGRITELCDTRWVDLDLVAGKWTKHHTKTDRKQIVPLPTQLVAILRTFAERSRDPYNHQMPAYVFQGHCGRPLLPESARKVWAAFRADLQMEQIWLLDFRRTLASYVYMHVKADEMLVKAILNHYDSRPCAVYTRLNFDFLAPIMQGYADWVWSFKQEVSDESVSRPLQSESADCLRAAPAAQFRLG
jgi:integrase